MRKEKDRKERGKEKEREIALYEDEIVSNQGKPFSSSSLKE